MKSLEIDFILDENIGKQGLGKLAGSPSPLSNTNLNRRSACLERILVSQFSKIQSPFKKTRNSFKEILSVRFQLLNSLLATARENSASCFSTNFISAQLKRAEINERNINMKFRIIDGGVGPQNSAEIQLQNKNSAQKYQSRKEFALNFISDNAINRYNFSSHVKFQGLTKNEKDAIRYYLKKQMHSDFYRPSDKAIKKMPKKSRGVLDIKIASFLMLPVLFSELIILTFSFRFYLDLGFELSMAIMAALSVELFFMASSGSSKRYLRLTRWVIFAYSAFTVCYSTYSNDPKIRSFKATSIQKTKDLEYQLSQQKKLSRSLFKQQEGLFADMEIYRKNQLVSIGRERVSKEKAALAKAIEENNQKISSISGEILRIKHSQTNSSVFSNEKIKLVEVRSWCVMIFLALIQLLSSVCTNEFCHSIRDFQKKRKRKLKKKSKGESYALQGANIVVQ